MPDWAPVTRLCAYGHENLLTSETCAECGAPLERMAMNGRELCTEVDAPAIRWSVEMAREVEADECVADAPGRRGRLRRLLPGRRRRPATSAGSDSPPVSS
jgi:hypothetical protein